MNDKQWFELGYRTAMRIKKLWSDKEIQERFPKANTSAFYNGMVDALHKDKFRLNICK